MRPKDWNALSAAKLHFIEPMYAKPVQSLPEGADWLYEVKLDGYRCLAGRSESGVTLWSRRGNVFTKEFLAVARGCEVLPLDTLVDGEVVALDKSESQKGVKSALARRNYHVCSIAQIRICLPHGLVRSPDLPEYAQGRSKWRECEDGAKGLTASIVWQIHI